MTLSKCNPRCVLFADRHSNPAVTKLQLANRKALHRRVFDHLRQRRGLAPLGGVSAVYDIEPALDRLAKIVRDSLDMDAIYERMGL